MSTVTTTFTIKGQDVLALEGVRNTSTRDFYLHQRTPKRRTASSYCRCCFRCIGNSPARQRAAKSLSDQRWQLCNSSRFFRCLVIAHQWHSSSKHFNRAFFQAALPLCHCPSLRFLRQSICVSRKPCQVALSQATVPSPLTPFPLFCMQKQGKANGSTIWFSRQ
jgi:hypothetical protein